ncbi:hypothetical protein ACE1CM_12295 [Microseira sp. BLCC-F43]
MLRFIPGNGLRASDFGSIPGGKLIKTCSVPVRPDLTWVRSPTVMPI